MTHQPPSHREELPIQRDLKKLQKQEQQVLEKLAEAREVQTRALKRFAQAQAHVIQMEQRLLAVRERLAASRTSHSQQKAAPAPQAPAESLPETGALESLDVCAEDREEAVRPTTLRAAPPSSPLPSESEEEESLLSEIAGQATQRATGAGVSRDEANEARRDAQEADQALDEVSQAILNGTLSGSEADTALQEAEQQANQAHARLAEIESLITEEITGAVTAMTENMQNPEADSAEAQDTSATDITTKIPVIRQHRRSEEQS